MKHKSTPKRCLVTTGNIFILEDDKDVEHTCCYLLNYWNQNIKEYSVAIQPSFILISKFEKIFHLTCSFQKMILYCDMYVNRKNRTEKAFLFIEFVISFFTFV